MPARVRVSSSPHPTVCLQAPHNAQKQHAAALWRAHACHPARYLKGSRVVHVMSRLVNATYNYSSQLETTGRTTQKHKYNERCTIQIGLPSAEYLQHRGPTSLSVRQALQDCCCCLLAPNTKALPLACCTQAPAGSSMQELLPVFLFLGEQALKRAACKALPERRRRRGCPPAHGCRVLRLAICAQSTPDHQRAAYIARMSIWAGDAQP